MTAARRRPRLPYLRAFVSGYLHQDFALDHASPAAALAAFLAECDPTERAGLRHDWVAFTAAVDGRAWAGVQRAFSRLGGAWIPAAPQDLEQLFSALTVGDRRDERPR